AFKIVIIRSADSAHKVHDTLQTPTQFVLHRLAGGYDLCKTIHLRDKRFDFACPVERIVPPWSGKISPLDEVRPRCAEAIERTSLFAGAQRRQPAQYSSQSGRHIPKRILDPSIESTRIYGCRLHFVEFLKSGWNASFDRPLTQDLCAKRM